MTTSKLTFVVPKAEDVQIVYTSMLPQQQLTFWFDSHKVWYNPSLNKTIVIVLPTKNLYCFSQISYRKLSKSTVLKFVVFKETTILKGR